MHVVLKREFDEDLERDWHYLENNNDLIIFQTFKWNKNWVEFNNIKNTLIFVVYDNRNPIAIFPFYKQKRFFLEILKWVGNDISDYLGPILDNSSLRDKNSFDLIWKKILSKTKLECDLIYLDKLTNNKSLFFNPITSFSDCEIYNINYGINLFEWNSVLKNKNKSIQQYRSKRKKLSLLGNFEFIDNVENLENKKKLISKMIQWKKKTKNKKDFIDTFEDKFYFDFLKNENLSISALKLNDKYIAGILGFKFKNDYYFLLPSYEFDSETFKFSPGRVLLIDLINFLYEKKFNYFNFCDGNQAYKKEWSNEKINLRAFLKSNNLKGFCLKYLLNFKLRNNEKKTYRNS